MFAVILAYSRETQFFYAYFVVRTLASMAGEGSFHCLALAYVVLLIAPSQTKINSLRSWLGRRVNLFYFLISL